MKKSLQIIFLIIIFCAFLLFELEKGSGSRVLEVITPTQLAVDLNNNGVVDEDEIVCTPEVTTLTANLGVNQNKLLESLKLTQEESVAAGYMADEFAKETLLNKRVNLEFRENHSPDCKMADIFVDEANYSDLLKSSGFGIVDGAPVKPELFKKGLEDAKKLNLVILNRKSGKYHKLTCKFGLNSSDYEILPEEKLGSKYEKCKYCILKKTDKSTKKQPVTEVEQLNPSNQAQYPEVFNSEGLKFMVSDYTSHLKPNSDCSHVFCKTVVDMINSTNSTLDMAIYDWNSIPKVNDAIANAKARGVKIRVIYDKRTGENYYPETDAFVKLLDNARSDEIEGRKNITAMLMHNKFMISDNKKVLTGSMNFSRTGLSGFNANSIAVIDSPDVANFYKNEFNQMFDGKFHTLKTQSGGNNTFKVGNSTLKVYFSPQDKTADKALVPLINSAEKYIYLPVFVITHKNITDALINARNRGVNVKIILDATATRTNHSTHTVLRKAGIPLKTENYAGKVHNKSMIIDDKYVVTGSMNFSNSGENKNDENCIIIENQELAKFYRGWFEFIWAKIPDKFLKYSARPESSQSIGSCYDGVDNDFDGKIDKADDGCKN